MDDTRDLLARAARSFEEARRASARNQRLVRTSREIQAWATRVQRRIAGDGVALELDPRGNFLLASLPLSELQRLMPQLQKVTFKAKQSLHRAGSVVDYIYFPLRGLISSASPMRDGNSIEISLTGNEGLLGWTQGLGSSISSYNTIVTIPGEGLRIGVQQFQQILTQGGSLPNLLAEYQNVCAVQVAYQVACNGLHDIDSRCCRRLLTVQDRTAGDILPVTHESLAMALGVRRASITEGLGQLQLSGAIKCRRGNIEILNRPKLQSLACECYQAINDEYLRIFKT